MTVKMDVSKSRDCKSSDSKSSYSHLMKNYGGKSLSIVKGQGCYLWDDCGRQYLDGLMGIAVCGLGHSHPAIAETIAKQASTLLHCSNIYAIPQQEELAEKLCSVSGMERVFFANSGAEANEAAIKLTRLHARDMGIEKPVVLVADGCFHGRTLATLSATSGAKVRQGFGPLVEGFVHIPYNDISAMREISDNSSVVAVMLEPVQGEGGIRIPDPGYLKAVRELCDANQWLLILDEIQSGNGRTGTYFACNETGITADILTTAKGLGNGVPIGACMARGRAAELFGPGAHGSTYGGNPLVCAVASKVFDIIRSENLPHRATALGNRLKSAITHQVGHFEMVKEIRHKGLMMAIEMEEPCPQLVKLAAENGLMINVTVGNCLRLLPALNMTDSEADTLVEKLCSTITQWIETK